MAITISDVEAFHRFAISRVTANEGTELTFDDLFLEWDSTCHQQEIEAAIRQGIADVNKGRTRNASDFNRELREQYKVGQ